MMSKNLYEMVKSKDKEIGRLTKTCKNLEQFIEVKYYKIRKLENLNKKLKTELAAEKMKL